ncbi:MAG: MFS transporter [Clostridia bacterium]|nr:MFS transporter [Clostridia bacterium]
MKRNYKLTMLACFVGYIVQGIANNYSPLLFVTFNETYGIPLSKIALLISVNFVVQLSVDLLCALVIEKTGWRVPIVFAHVLAFGGLLMLAVLPDLMDNKFAALLISVVVLASGGGFLEALVSPIIESCPTDNKSGVMSLLHSFYCWGYCGVVVISTLFFGIFGIQKWHILAAIWALIPLLNAIVFAFAPLNEDAKEERETRSFGGLFKNRYFLILIVIMFCAACCELSVAQWSSAFAEKALGISKTMGDLFGPLFFAVLMGISRLIYGFYLSKKNIDLEKVIFYSGILCIVSYLVISLCPVPMISLIGVGICGFSVGILWPGSFSLGAANIKNGGSTMFALLALFGDLGCSTGPFVVGTMASLKNDDLNFGILIATVFPVIMCLCLFSSFRKKPENKKS